MAIGLIIAATGGCLCAAYLSYLAIIVKKASTDYTSFFMNLLLQSLKPSCSTRGANALTKPVPSLDYKWPNGQGTEKFFEGTIASRRWMEENGPVYQIWSGIKPEVVLTKPEHLRDFYRDSDKHIKAVNNNSGWLVGELLGSCLGLVSQERWQRVRTHWSHLFTPTLAQSYTPVAINHAREYVDRLLQSQPNNVDTVIQFDVVDGLKLYPFITVAEILFGLLSEKQEKTLIGLVPEREELFRLGIKGGINRTRLAPLLQTKAYRMLCKYQASWRAFVVDAYESSRALDKNAMVEELWGKVVNDNGMSEQECLQTLDEVLFANLDVTTSAVSWTHVLIAQHPGIQQDVRQEIAQHRDQWDEYINNPNTLLAGCVLEASRLHPILPFSNPEAATVDKIVGGVAIPRGVDVIVDTHAINVDNPYWVDGTSYNPRRFSNMQSQQYRYHFWRFGFGPRQCLGKYLSDRLVRALLGELLGRCEISLHESNKDNSSFGLQDESWVGLPQVRICCKPIIEGSE
ncbi:hypothetical protein VHEMI02392 [[Torrubiella] hemipterigena]|uniref:Cytochrome P450 n=1 Tax=[Torrubiella] hemipterigena TaxID=1531966 RepID=A0A0A1SVM0_9HYPO|nr:hypothetical protein VHEMI02392 [[Torrubiella] hemipterigena]